MKLNRTKEVSYYKSNRPMFNRCTFYVESYERLTYNKILFSIYHKNVLIKDLYIRFNVDYKNEIK